MTRFRIAGTTLSLCALALVIGACSAEDACGRATCCSPSPAPVRTVPGAPPVVAPPVVAPAPAAAAEKAADAAATAAVHNYVRVSPKLARGASPEGDAAFAALAAAGIRSIVSVDGAAPDVATAKRHGLRYVHVPFGYDGVPEATALELAKTFEILAPAGPIFVHCHHGKHRGPAASGIGHILLDGATNEAALADMKLAGTDPKYKGLYEAIRTFRRPTPEALAGVSAELPEVATRGTRAAAMAAIDHTWANLNAARAATWSVPKDHADVDPPHESVILAEGLREFGRRPEIAAESEAFRTLLAAGEAAAWDLSKALETGKVDAGRAEAAFTALQRSCVDCHTQFRDNTHR